jgi:hypothetical protein
MVQRLVVSESFLTLEVIDINPVVQGFVRLPVNKNLFRVKAPVLVGTIWDVRRADVVWKQLKKRECVQKVPVCYKREGHEDYHVGMEDPCKTLPKALTEATDHNLRCCLVVKSLFIGVL